MADFAVYPDREPSKAARELAEQVERDGGRVLAIYQEPVGDHWQIFCLCRGPRWRRAPTTDVRPARPAADGGGERLDRFVDPSSPSRSPACTDAERQPRRTVLDKPEGRVCRPSWWPGRVAFQCCR